MFKCKKLWKMWLKVIKAKINNESNTLSQTVKSISVESSWKDGICYCWVFRVFNCFAYTNIYHKMWSKHLHLLLINLCILQWIKKRENFPRSLSVTVFLIESTEEEVVALLFNEKIFFFPKYTSFFLTLNSLLIYHYKAFIKKIYCANN